MKARFVSLAALLLLASAVAWAQGDWPDGPWAVKNADIYATNVNPAPYLFGSGGAVLREVPFPVDENGSLIIQPPRHGFHSQIMFDSRGNLYWRGSNNEPSPNPNESVSIYSLDPNGKLRWKSDNLFGHFRGWGGVLVGQQRVYAVGCQFGKMGPGTRPVLAALDKNTGATIWSLELPPGPANWATVLALADGTLYAASEPWLKNTGEEDIKVVTGYAIDAASGTIVFKGDFQVPDGVPISKPESPVNMPNQSFTIVPDAFPGREPGIFFSVSSNVPGEKTVVAVSLATGAVKWTAIGEKANQQHLIYSPVNRELYKVSWSDYGHTFTVYDVATGTVKGRLATQHDSVLDPIEPTGGGTPLRHEIGGHGWCDTASLLADGRSIVTAAFSGVVVIYSSDGQGNLSSRILLSGPSHWGEMHHFAQIIRPATGQQVQDVWIAMTRHNNEDPLQSESVQVIAVDVATGQVLWQLDTGIWGPNWYDFYALQVGARAPVAVSPSGKLYYVRWNKLYIIEPAEAPQVDGTVILDGFFGSPNYGSGDGEWVVAPPLTLEFREPGTTNMLFHKSIALNVNTISEVGGGIGHFRLNNIPAGVYDIAAKSYVQDRFGTHYEFSHWLRAVAQGVAIPETGTGSAAVELYLINADADNDNEVTLFDFGVLVQAFGALRGDGNWNQAA
ncbi:MAG: outer membrane protein assembly factor BamB family protein, partial [Armatimonadota bacterium]